MQISNGLVSNIVQADFLGLDTLLKISGKLHLSLKTQLIFHNIFNSVRQKCSLSCPLRAISVRLVIEHKHFCILICILRITNNTHFSSSTLNYFHKLCLHRNFCFQNIVIFFCNLGGKLRGTMLWQIKTV